MQLFYTLSLVGGLYMWFYFVRKCISFELDRDPHKGEKGSGTRGAEWVVVTSRWPLMNQALRIMHCMRLSDAHRSNTHTRLLSTTHTIRWRRETRRGEFHQLCLSLACLNLFALSILMPFSGKKCIMTWLDFKGTFIYFVCNNRNIISLKVGWSMGIACYVNDSRISWGSQGRVTFRFLSFHREKEW